MQQNMKLILSVFSAFALGCVLTVASGSLIDSLIPVKVSSDLPPSNDVDNNGEYKLATCLADLDFLKSKLASGVQQTSESINHSLSSSSIGNLPEVKSLEFTQAMDASQKTREFTEWLHKKAEHNIEFNLEEALSKSFNEEAVDYSWAPSQEQVVYDLFSTNPELVGFALKSAQCKTSECRISVGINDVNQSNQLVEIVGKLLQATDKNKTLSIYAAPNQKMGYTTIFFRR